MIAFCSAFCRNGARWWRFAGAAKHQAGEAQRASNKPTKVANLKRRVESLFHISPRVASTQLGTPDPQFATVDQRAAVRNCDFEGLG